MRVNANTLVSDLARRSVAVAELLTWYADGEPLQPITLREFAQRCDVALDVLVYEIEPELEEVAAPTRRKPSKAMFMDEDEYDDWDDEDQDEDVYDERDWDDDLDEDDDADDDEEDEEDEDDDWG